MREYRGIVRGAALLLGGVIALTALSGCTRKSEDLEEQVAADPDVALVEEGTDGGYLVTLDDAVPSADLAGVAVRLSDLVDSATDDEVRLRLRAGAWEWALAEDEAEATAHAQAVGELAGVDGILQGSVWSDDGSVGIEAVATAGVDPVGVVMPLADAAAAGPLSAGLTLTVSDVHERSSVETRDPAALQPALDTVAAVGAVAPIQKYSLEDDSLVLRMRTADGAAAAASALDALAADAPQIEVALSGGIITTPPLQEELAARLSTVLTPFDGVVGASIDTHGPKALHLSVTTADAETAATVQQALLASPDLQAFNSLQVSVLKPDEPGTWVTAKTMSEEGYVANFDRALGLAQTDGVRSVAFGPGELDVVVAHGVDVAEMAPAIKAAALRDQEAEIFDSTSWAPVTDRPLFSFDVLGKLHENLVEVSAGTADDDVQGFIVAWNDAPGL